MTVFLAVALASFVLFALSFLAFDDIDLGDALDFTDDGSSGWFSLRSILLFGMGFGSAGALLTQSQYTPPAASAGGVGYGLVLYLVGVVLAKLMTNQSSNSQKKADDLVGKTGVVTVPMGTGSIGAVRITTSKGMVDCMATAEYMESYGVGERVVVLRSNGVVALVKKEAA